MNRHSDPADLPVVNCINSESLERLRQFLRQNNWRVFEIDGSDIEDKPSLLAKVADHLPHEPDLIARDSWDAWVDTLWGGLAGLNEERVAFVWTHAERMLVRGLPDLLTAVECIQNLASDVSTADYGFPRPMLLRLFLVGEGDNFKPL